MEGKVIIMDGNGNDRYLDSINHKIEKLDLIKKQYEDTLMEKSQVLEHNNSSLDKLKSTKDILQYGYNSLIRLLEEQGIIFEVNFGEYIPHQWENLVIVKATNGYQIQTKMGHVLMMLDQKYYKIIGDINKKKSQSLIVIRVTDKVALVQLRFH